MFLVQYPGFEGSNHGGTTELMAIDKAPTQKMEQ
jgi:hypothetical protein